MGVGRKEDEFSDLEIAVRRAREVRLLDAMMGGWSSFEIRKGPAAGCAQAADRCKVNLGKCERFGGGGLNDWSFERMQVVRSEWRSAEVHFVLNESRIKL